MGLSRRLLPTIRHKEEEDDDENHGIQRDKIETLLTTIASIEKEKRNLLKSCCQSRARLKELQQSLAPSKKKKKDKNRDNNDMCSTTHCSTTHQNMKDIGHESSHGLHNVDNQTTEEKIIAIREEIKMLKEDKIPKLLQEIEL